MTYRIVQLTYYSTRRPVSGGQKRIAALRGEMARLGHEVSLIEVFSWMEALHPDDFKFPAYDDEWARRFPSEYECRAAEVLRANRALGTALLERIEEHAPDILWLEQPFLWPFLAQHGQPGSGRKLVYSSHNIEWRIRGELARHGQLGPYPAFRIQEMEQDLIRAADLVVNVSEPDRRWCEDAGAKATLLLRNASSHPSVLDPSAERARFRAEHGLADDAMVLLYVSAYWEPNWLGLADWVLPCLTELAERHHVRLLLVGGIGLRADEADLTEVERALIVSTGEVEEATKNAAYAACDAVLLPVVSGGGTNLKSAEALLSDRPVLASAFAMRGLEMACHGDGVRVAADAKAFSEGMRVLVLEHAARRTAGDPPCHRKADPDVVRACSWETALDPLGAALERIGRS